MPRSARRFTGRGSPIGNAPAAASSCIAPTSRTGAGESAGAAWRWPMPPKAVALSDRHDADREPEQPEDEGRTDDEGKWSEHDPHASLYFLSLDPFSYDPDGPDSEPYYYERDTSAC